VNLLLNSQVLIGQSTLKFTSLDERCE
ncbi:unnamed protein product, partial [Rhizophagus irregularis]